MNIVCPRTILYIYKSRTVWACCLHQRHGYPECVISLQCGSRRHPYSHEMNDIVDSVLPAVMAFPSSRSATAQSVYWNRSIGLFPSMVSTSTAHPRPHHPCGTKRGIIQLLLWHGNHAADGHGHPQDTCRTRKHVPSARCSVTLATAFRAQPSNSTTPTAVD